MDKATIQPIIIVGAGWSGLACAISLVEQGYPVCLLESARQIGGRAKSLKTTEEFSHQAIDNGQHIMLGAYQETLELFKTIWPLDTPFKESQLILRQALEFQLFSPDKQGFRPLCSSYNC